MSIETKAFGLRARRSDIGGNPTYTVRLPVTAGSNTVIYKGDVVELNPSTGTVDGVLTNTNTAQDTNAIIGAIAQVGYINSVTGRPVIGKVLPASTAASTNVDGTASPWVDVEMSQGGLFEVLSVAAGTASLTAANTLGRFFGLITNGSPDTVMQQSAVQLQPNSGATYGTTAGGATAATDRVVQVVGLAEEPNNNWGDATLKLVVRFVKTPINQ